VVFISKRIEVFLAKAYITFATFLMAKTPARNMLQSLASS